MVVTDKQLIARAASGDQEAAAELHRRYSRLVYSILRRRFRFNEDDLCDVYQTVWEKLLERECRRLQAWRGESSLGAYIAIVTLHAGHDFQRSQPRARHAAEAVGVDVEEIIPEETVASRDPRVEDEVAARQQQRALQECIDMLAEREARLIRLRHIQGLSYAEIGAALQMTVSHVGVALTRAERRLRALARERHPELFPPDW